MSSADNTIETADGNSTVDQSLPSTTSVLDRSRSLFGNSSAVLSTPDRQSTPDEPVGETSEENYAIEEVTETLVETPVDQEDESLKPADEEPMDTAESETTPEPEKEAEEATEDKEQNGEADEQDVEESFEKKTISMDTGGDEDEPVEEPMDSEDNDEQEKETEEKEEEHEEVEDEEEETPKRKAKRAAPTSEDEDVEEQTEKSEDKEEKVEEEEEKEEQEEKEETPEEETPKRNTRGRRSTASTSSAKRGKGRASEVKKDDEEATEEVEEQTPKRGGRARRSTVQETPEVEESSSRPRRSVRGRKSNVEPEPEPEPEEEKEEEVEEKEEEVGEEKKPKKGRKSKAQEVEAVEEEEEAVADEEPEVPTSSRRSARSKPPPKSAPVTPATKRTPARGRKKQTSLTEEPIEEEEPETPKRGRAAAKNTPASSKKKNESSFDPYDLDTEMEHHPEPLKNIHMEVQNFGAVKYAKVGSSESKYAMTEKAAESRISNLPATPSNKNRRSLADMTPGKEKVKHKTPVVSVGRKPRAKKGGEPEEEDVEMEATPERASSSATSSTSNRGRKRKSEAVESAPSSAKKQPTLLRTLSEEEQLQVDHPSNENEPHAPGARVYALFQKTFYPAIIMAERDGMGRYKLQFTADKVIKDVPNAGIIPLRAVSAGKTAIFEEEEVHIRAGTNDISSSEWAKGQVLIVILDEDGEPTDEEKTISWQDISFDQTEWRDYIKDKEQNATAVVSSNITTPLEATRARKPRSIVQSKPPTKPKSHPKITGDLAPSRGASTPRNFDDEDDDKLLPMNEEGVGKNIFAGKVFMLTSANRTTDRYVPSVFKKKNMMEFITQNGGVVTELLDERYSTSDSILISDTYYRTHKYLAALARGVPCVSNLWLQACGEQGEMVDFAPFILPAGASIFDDEDKPAPRDPSKLLEGKTMYVHSVHTTREITQNGPGGTFIEIWNPILELLGAKTVYGDWKDLPQSQLKFDIVLVDGTFQREVMDYAESIGAATVTSEWVIQSIILNGPPDPKSHPKFDPHRLNQRSPV